MVEGRAFELAGDDRGVLCLHGFTGTPFEVSHLGQRIHERGLTVVAPCLPGHHTTPADLDRTGWRDWYAAAESAFLALASRCRMVAIAGQSMGGLLALRLAAMHPEQVSAVAALAVPLWLPAMGTATDWLTRRVPMLAARVPMLPKLGGVDVRDPAMKERSPSYRVIPVRALHQLCDLMQVVLGQLPAVRAPLLVMHSHQDHTAPFECSRTIARRVRSRTVVHRELFDSFHLLPIDVDREQVAREVGDFVERELARRERCAM